MRILFTVLFLFLFTLIPSFAKDEVITKNGSLSGKITAYSDGLFHFRSNGSVQSYVREKNSDFYGDYIMYKKSPIGRGIIETYCRIVFIDEFKVIYKTQNSRVEVLRYRVKNIVLNAN